MHARWKKNRQKRLVKLVQKDYRQKDNAAAETNFSGLGLTLKTWPGYVFYGHPQTCLCLEATPPAHYRSDPGAVHATLTGCLRSSTLIGPARASKTPIDANRSIPGEAAATGIQSGASAAQAAQAGTRASGPMAEGPAAACGLAGCLLPRPGDARGRWPSRPPFIERSLPCGSDRAGGSVVQRPAQSAGPCAPTAPFFFSFLLPFFLCSLSRWATKLAH
jgi:hypothetical protein